MTRIPLNHVAGQAKDLQERLEMSTAEIGLTVRTTNCLEEKGIFNESPARKLKIVVAGAHPDDPELGAGGTIARYADLGHEVVCLYLTRGQVGRLKDVFRIGGLRQKPPAG